MAFFAGHDSLTAWDHLNTLKWAGAMEEYLRLWLAGQLGRNPEVDRAFDKLWRTLKSEDHVEMAKVMSVTGDSEEEEQAKKDLLATAKLLLPYAESEVSSTPPIRSTGKRTRRVTLRQDGYEKERAEALGEYVALRASMHPLVRRFREEVLGEKALTPEQAHALVGSDAANRFTLKRFEQHGISVIEHTASFYEHGVVSKKLRTDKFIEFEYIFVDPPGELLQAHLPVSVAYDDLEYLWFPREGSMDAREGAHSSVLHDADHVPTPVYPGSVLDNLRQLSQRLVTEYGRCWDEAQAAWFVLTGEPVAARAITAEYQDHYSEHLIHGTIALTVEPWVPTETLVKVYQHLQAEMLERKPRAPERRNLAVFRFVVGQSKKSSPGGEDQDEAVEERSWHELMEHWNQANPDQKYLRESRFRRDFHRGARAILSPYDASDLWRPGRLSVP